MAARGGAEEAGGSQGIDEGEGDPAFDLLEATAKRGELKRRAKEASAQQKGPKSRPGAGTRGTNEPPDAAVRGRAAPPAAAAAAVEVEAAEDDACLEVDPPPKTPTIAQRNREAPRDRSLSSEKRLREAVQNAAELAAERKRKRQPQLGAVPEAAGEQEGEAAIEDEDGDEDDDDEDEDEPEALDPARYGRPVRSDADLGKVSYPNLDPFRTLHLAWLHTFACGSARPFRSSLPWDPPASSAPPRAAMPPKSAPRLCAESGALLAQGPCGVRNAACESGEKP